MKLHHHDRMIKYALRGLDFGNRQIERIIEGSDSQDNIFGHLQDGKRHFDRDMIILKRQKDKSAHRFYFYKAKNYLLNRRDAVLGFIAYSRYKFARLALGEALHTLQDFFAHSNFTDLNNVEKDMISSALREKTDIEIPETLKLMYPGLSGLDEYDHNTYNKDDEDRPGYPLVKEAARAHSKEFVLKLKQEIIQTYGIAKWDKFRGAD